MIFVTVGTHEQQFDRLVRKVDELRKTNMIKEDVFVQTGYSTYEPKNCKWSKMLPYDQMQEYIANARIVITHGGPSSFIAPLQIGKIPIVVPRKKEFEEHVNDHQVEFVKLVAERQGNIIPVYDIKDLENTIINYDKIIKIIPGELKSNNTIFNQKLEKIVEGLFTK